MGVLVAAVLLCAAFAWRLGQGPVSLSWAVPAIDFVLDQTIPQLRVKLGNLVVTWLGWDDGLDLRLLNVTASTREGLSVARIPKVGVGLSLEALKRFRLAPTQIHLYGPRLRLVRQEDGALEFSFVGTEGDGSATSFDEFVRDALEEPRDPADPFSYLDVVTVTGGRMAYVDRQLNAEWRGHLTHGQVLRIGKAMALEADLRLTAGHDTARARIDALAASATESVAVQIQLREFRPAAFASVTPALAPLNSIDVPLDGTTAFTTTWTGAIRDLRVDIEGGPGTISVTEPLALQLGLDAAAAQQLSVRELALSGHYDAAADEVIIAPSGITFGEATTLHLPAPIDQTFPLASIAGHGRYDLAQDALTGAAFDLDLDGPKVRVEGEVHELSGDLNGHAKLLIHRVKVDELGLYWPKVVAPGGRDWALSQMSSGVLEQGELNIAFGPTERGTDVTELDGQAQARGLHIDYLPPAPPLQNAAGSAKFDLSSLTVDIAGGDAGGLTITGGTATISGFENDAPTLQLKTDIIGTVPAALQFLASEPLGFTKDLGINAAATRGAIDTTLELELPLDQDVDASDVALRADAEVTDLFIPDALIGGNVTGGTLQLDIDEKGMDVFGPVSFENIGARIAWHESFDGSEPYVRRIDLNVPTIRVDQLRRIEPDVVATLKPWVDGPLSAQATVTFNTADEIVFDADVDASRGSLTFPPLGWSKPAGARAFIFAKGRFDGDRLTGIDRATISAPALEAAGSLALTRDGGLQRVIVDRLISGNTDASAIVTAIPGSGWDVVIGGNRLDVQPLLADRDRTDAGAGGGPLDTFTLSADLDRLRLFNETPIEAVSATVIRNRGVFDQIQIEGVVGNNASIRIDVSPTQPGRRTLRARAEDAGAALRALGILSDIQGGRLRIDGTFNDTDPRIVSLDGTLKIKRFHLTGAPILAQILNVMALTGIIDLLRGEGIAFSTLDAPFSLQGDLLSLNEAKMHGNAMGVTAAGTYDIARDAIGVRGTLIPFYVLNSLLGRLPIIGGLFSGGERGGGLFAVRYSVGGTMQNPEVTVNPVSALTPGFLRNIFSLFDQPPRQEPFPPLPQHDP